MDLSRIKVYLPYLGMVLATVLNTLYTSAQDNRLSLAEGLMLLLSLAGAITTYVVPRLPNAPWLKTLMAGITAALVAIVAAFSDNVMSMQDWIMVAIQLLVGLGIVVGTSKNVPIAQRGAMTGVA